MRPIELIVIHHSASPRETTVEQIRTWHEANPKIGKLAYHFLVLGNGTVFPGQPVSSVGAHARGHNLKSIGVCVVGDNTKGDATRWTLLQTASLRALVETLKIFWPAAEVLGHRDLPGAATECPGLNVRALLARGE